MLNALLSFNPNTADVIFRLYSAKSCLYLLFFTSVVVTKRVADWENDVDEEEDPFQLLDSSRANASPLSSSN